MSPDSSGSDNVEPLESHRQALEQFAEELLRPYIERVTAGHLVREPKEFNDPIWGTIRLSPLEVTILDSPLLQRLRRIRQLGVVHLSTWQRRTHASNTVSAWCTKFSRSWQASMRVAS